MWSEGVSVSPEFLHCHGDRLEVHPWQKMAYGYLKLNFDLDLNLKKET